MNILSAWLIIVIYLALACPPWRNILHYLRKHSGDWSIVLLFLPYLLAVGFHPSITDVCRFLFCLALPTILLRIRPQHAKPFDIYQILAILALWIFIEPDLFVLLFDLIIPGIDFTHTLTGFSLLPEAKAMLVPGVDIPVRTMTVIVLSFFLFLIYYPVTNVGFTFYIGPKDIRYALIGLFAFIIVGLPIGYGIGFLRFNPTLPGFMHIAVRIIGGYLLVALLEEFFYRGIIQNLLSQRFGREWPALLLASFIFGLAHLNNTTKYFSVPNWPYVLMATVAGICYGWIWIKTKKVTVSAITHMLVNLIWYVLFR
ncbi:MAG: CPBP family intramembrane metalloprotease [Planctomycetes bacterium]|nr:CPBP family intramembrane metalloprotease [Planctomycetota bacterium]